MSSLHRLLALAALSLLAGCHSAQLASQPGTLVILIDKSASTTGPKNAAYADYLQKYVFPAITPGTRVIVEPVVGANTYSDPALRIVATMPTVTMLHKDLAYYLFKGDISADKKCLAQAQTELAHFNQARAELQADAQRILRTRDTSSSTFLLDGMKEASESLEQRSGRGTLVVLSDGLEDSTSAGKPLRFNDDSFWSHHPPAALVRDLDPARAAPGLKSVDVYLVGLAAASGPTYTNVRDFWKAYFRAAATGDAAIGHQPLYNQPTFNPTAQALCE